MDAVAKAENRVKDHKQPRRLSKQEEVDLENESNNSHSANSETGCMVPVTIHVEDKGDVTGETEECYEGSKASQQTEYATSSSESEKESSSSMHHESSRQSVSFVNQLAVNGESFSEKDKKRNKLLTRSKALPDDASPPPEIDGSKLSSNRLTVSGSGNQLKKGGSSSQGSNDGSSPSLSRDSSTETYTDSTGTDLHQFLIETLQNQKDRIHLLKIEQELTALVKDNERQYHKFPPMSSYHRMLVHRVAAFFGMEHNVDTHGNSVVVNKSKSTRLPDMKFGDYTKDGPSDEPKKLILKRDSASFEENSGSSNSNGGKEKSPDRRNNNNLVDTRRSKSFEEREEQYERARARIFNQGSSSSTDAGDGSSYAHAGENELLSSVNQDVKNKNSSPRSSQDDAKPNWSAEGKQWSSTDSDSSARPQYLQLHKQKRLAHSLDSDTTKTSITASSSVSSSSGMFLTPDSCVSEKVLGADNSIRPSVTKASSFGGITVLSQESSSNTNGGSRLTKAGSFNVSRSNDPSTNSSGAFTNVSGADPKQSYSQSQHCPVPIPPPPRVPPQTSHTNQNNHRNQHWSNSVDNTSQPWFQQQQQSQALSQQVHVLQPSQQLQSWAPYNNSGSMLLVNNRIVDSNIRGGDKGVHHVVVPGADGYIQPHFMGDQSQNSYRNHAAAVAEKNGFQPLNAAGQNGAVVYVPCVSQQFQHHHQHNNNKHANNNSSARNPNSSNRLNSQFSTMSINSMASRENQHRGDYSSGGKNESFSKHSYNASVPRNMVRAQNHVLPVDSSANGNPIPLCYVHSLPQNVNIGPNMSASQPQMPPELVYPNSLQSNVMIVGSQMASSAPPVPNQYQNMPLQLPQGAMPIPQQSPQAPVLLPPNQPQLLRNGQQSVQQPPPMAYPISYQFSSQVHQNTSQGATYPYGAPVKQVPACMPVYVVSNGSTMTPNQPSNMRPSSQSAPVLSTPYAQPPLFRTPSPPQPSQTPPLALTPGGQPPYIGYTICTPPPANGPPAAINNVSVNQNAAINVATQTFMTMLRAQAAAANNPTNIENQPQAGKRFSSPPHPQLVPNQNTPMPRFAEYSDVRNTSAPNKYPHGYVLTGQNSVMPGNNPFCRRLPGPLSATHPLDLRILNPSPAGAVLAQSSFLVGNNSGGKPLVPYTQQGSNTYPTRHKGRRPKTKPFHNNSSNNAYSPASSDVNPANRTHVTNSQSRKSNVETSNSLCSVVSTSRCSEEPQRYQVLRLPAKIKKMDLEEYLKPVKHLVCSLEYFAIKPNEDGRVSLEKPLNLKDDSIIESEVLHKVVASFDGDALAQQALEVIKNSDFKLFPLEVQTNRTDPCVDDSKNNVDG